jgi:DNA polymerase-1
MTRERCEDCPLKDRVCVPGHGRAGGLMIIGEAPGGTEARKGLPFVGVSGRLLKDTLRAAHLRPEQTYITNAVICHPPGNKTPSAQMVEACRRHLIEEVNEVNPSKILTVGSTPLKALFGPTATVSKIRGLGQYVDIPTGWTTVQRITYKQQWVDQKFMDEHEPIKRTTDDRYQFVGWDKNDTGIYYDWADLEVEVKHLKTTTKYKLWKQVLHTDEVATGHRKVFTVATYHPAYVLRETDLFREFAYDVEKIIRQSRPLTYPRIDTWIVRTPAEAVDAVAAVLQASVVGCDTETTSEDPRKAHLLSIGFGAVLNDNPDWDGIAVIIPKELIDDPDVKRVVQGALDGSQFAGVLAFHNIKYDVQVFENHGYTCSHPTFTDTMMLAYHWDERPSIPDEMGTGGGGKRQGRSLKTLARVFYDVPNYAFDFEDFNEAMAQGTLTDDDWDQLYVYHGMDCYLTARMYFDLKNLLDTESEKLYPLAQNVSVPACLTFAEVENRGIKIDLAYLRDLRVRYVEQMQKDLRILQEMWDAKGLAMKTVVGPFNPGSPPQVQKLLDAYEITTENTRRDPLLHFKATLPKDDIRRPMIDALISYRLTSKTIATYIDGLIKRADANGRVHTEYHIDGTATGRTSSSNPNLQNIPAIMGSDIRAAFTSDDTDSDDPNDEWVLLNVDYSQLQLRIAGCKQYSGDTNIRNAYLEGQDIHKIVSAKLFRKTIEEVTKDDRFWAKRIDFGVLFGRSAQAILEGAEIAEMKERGGTPWTRREAEFFLSEFFEGFPELKVWIDAQHRRGLKQRYVEDPLGRRRRFPFIAPGERGHVERQTVNTPIQAGEAEVLLSGIARLQRMLAVTRDAKYVHEQKAYIVLSVHDSITLELRRRNITEVSEICREALERHPPFDTDIPFKVEIEVGKRWSEMEAIHDEAPA